MIQYVATSIWLGGMIPAYRHAKKHGCGTFGCYFQCLFWPADIGWVLADHFCRRTQK